MRSVRISICDRNRLSSQLLAESLGRNPQFEIVAVTGSEEVLSSAFARKPDLIVLSTEFDSGKEKGLLLTRSLNIHQPDIFVVMLVDASDRDNVIACFRCGATGIFSRTGPASELSTCIEHVSRGEIWAGPSETQHLLQLVRSTPSWNGIDNVRVRSLAKREMEVAELASSGQSNKQIAEVLNLSEHTVKNYLFKVFEKLGISNRFELLFLLFNARAGEEPGRLGLSQTCDPLEVHLKAAEEGSSTSQFVLGLAYLHGTGVDKNLAAAYCWLRMAQKSSANLQEQSLAAIEEMKGSLRPSDLAALDRKVESGVRKLCTPETNARSNKSELPGLRRAV